MARGIRGALVCTSKIAPNLTPLKDSNEMMCSCRPTTALTRTVKAAPLRFVAFTNRLC